MKVLHISHSPLPDARIERMGLFGTQKDWETYFLGPIEGECFLGNSVFKEYIPMQWNYLVNMGLQPFLKYATKSVLRVIEKVKPDIIHAHDLFGAKLVHDTGHRFVFDDHEHSSISRRALAEWKGNNLWQRMFASYEASIWDRWENEILQTAPIITVSETIAKHYRSLGGKVFVIPNYPSEYEISHASFSDDKEDDVTATYLGNDISRIYASYRDSNGVLEMFEDLDMKFVVVGDNLLKSRGKTKSLGFIHHMKLFGVMSKFHIGLVPWKRHWYHESCSLNKAYIYAHCGLVTVFNSQFTGMIAEFGKHCKIFDTMDNLRRLLQELKEQDIEEMGKETTRFARQKLVFEQHTDQLIDAYEAVTGEP